MFCWGTVMTLMGLISSYRGLLIARFFLGVAEAGFFPAASYLVRTIMDDIRGRNLESLLTAARLVDDLVSPL